MFLHSELGAGKEAVGDADRVHPGGRDAELRRVQPRDAPPLQGDPLGRRAQPEPRGGLHPSQLYSPVSGPAWRAKGS